MHRTILMFGKFTHISVWETEHSILYHVLFAKLLNC